MCYPQNNTWLNLIVLCEMQLDSFKIWIQFTKSTSYKDNHFATNDLTNNNRIIIVFNLLKWNNAKVYSWVYPIIKHEQLFCSLSSKLYFNLFTTSRIYIVSPAEEREPALKKGCVLGRTLNCVWWHSKVLGRVESLFHYHYSLLHYDSKW